MGAATDSLEGLAQLRGGWTLLERLGEEREEQGHVLILAG
jgi:hypothetical protein